MSPADILRNHWGFSHFKGSQEQIIQAVLSNRDVLALLPTGGGKSVCYQVPALSREGLCLVVSPLVALIQDQVAGLKKKGLKAIALTGGLHHEEVIDLLDNCQYGNYKFLYLSPERLQQSIIQERISQMRVNLIAIDEAHCISHWGNDFRPAYLQCSLLRELQPGVPVIALTATATSTVAADIIENLKLRDTLVVKDSFLRDNIAYKVLREEDKPNRLRELCEAQERSGIVYVRTRRMAEVLARNLSENGCPAAHFHGGMPRREKEEVLKRWLASRVQFMVATNAFGMGVDKPDVGLVVHYQIPDSIENYFQEAGRAGRNGNEAEALLLTNESDELQLRKQFLSVMPDVPFLKLLYKKLNNYFQIPYGTGENSTYYFQFNAFCAAYKFNGMLAYNGLQLLDQHSVIALSPHFKQQTSIRFLASKGALWSYLEQHPAIASLIQLLLRTYGGIFDFDTKINTFLIAKKGRVSEAVVLEVLEQLHKDGIIDYQAAHGDLEITFLVPREDEHTIHQFAHLVREHQKVKTGQIDSMLAYVRNNKLCRSKQLLKYFGEEGRADCGKCDVCLGKKPFSFSRITWIETQIISLLGTGPMPSRRLVNQVNAEEAAVLKALQLLLEDGRICINSRNEYSLI